MALSRFDRLTLRVAPRWTANRLRWRHAAETMVRHYEAAATGRRTSGWTRNSADANAVIREALGKVRDHARDLVRNNPWATKGLAVVANNAVSWGIVPKVITDSAGVRARDRAARLWADWADNPNCDFDGRHTFHGLQHENMRSTVKDGEVLVRRRWIGSRAEMRRLDLPIPLQLQVIEGDFLDTAKEGRSADGGFILQGVEFNARGQRVAYWLFPEHPGAGGFVRGFGASERVPAEDVQHLYWPDRPGQVRGISWFSPVVVRLKDHDEFEDATLLRQKIAACFAGVVTDIDGAASTVGTDPESPADGIDTIEPGTITYLPIGKQVTFANPPAVTEQAAYSATVLRGIAAGLGIMYEQLTGDWSNVNFSSGRLGRQDFLHNVHQWRWNLLIPHSCRPTWRWVMDAAVISGALTERPQAKWTPPPAAMIEPDKEGLAIARNIRSGILTGPEALREQGYDPDEWIEEQREWLRKLDAAGIILDSDPRKTTQAGNPRESQKASAGAAAPSKNA